MTVQLPANKLLPGIEHLATRLETGRWIRRRILEGAVEVARAHETYLRRVRGICRDCHRSKLVTQNTGHKTGPWTTSELQTLRRSASLGAEAVGQILDRTAEAVRCMAYDHGISLRRPGSRRGLVMGQLRGDSLMGLEHLGISVETGRWMRQRILDGALDLARVDEIYRRRLRLALGAPLCPMCAVNPQEVEAKGMCRDCHYRSLAEAHRLQDSDLARRELWAAKQDKGRRRRRLENTNG